MHEMTSFRDTVVGWIGAAVALAGFGCGARTELDDRPIPRVDPKPAATTAPKPAEPRPPSNDATGRPKDPSLGTSNPLGECVLGEAPRAGQACPYIAQNRCYPDPGSACACICPRDVGDTTCTEGFFPNDQGAIDVRCF